MSRSEGTQRWSELGWKRRDTGDRLGCHWLASALFCLPLHLEAPSRFRYRFCIMSNQQEKPHRKLVRHIHEPGNFHELTSFWYRRMPLLTNNDWRRWLSVFVNKSLTFRTSMEFHLVHLTRMIQDDIVQAIKTKPATAHKVKQEGHWQASGTNAHLGRHRTSDVTGPISRTA